MSPRSRLGLLVIAAALASACGPSSYSDFRNQLVDSSCRWAKTCGYVGQVDRAACPTDDLLTIFHDSSLDRSSPGAFDVAASIDKGRMRYDSIHAQDCLDTISGSPCDTQNASRKRALACNSVIGANVETDRPCWADVECTGGICVHAPGCAGTCGNYASPGAPCVDSDDAPLTVHCDSTVGYCGPATVGADLTCQRKHREGEMCTQDRECLFGWTCRQGTCVTPIELGEGAACGGIDPCNSGLYCEPSTLLCARQHAITEPCTSSVGCSDGLACLGLIAVDPMGVPTPVKTSGVCGNWLDVGLPCKAVGGDPEPSVTACPSLSQKCMGGVCVAIDGEAGLGESCASAKCAAGLACDKSMRCDYARAIFGDCSDDKASLCETGLVCGGGVDLGADGTTCVPPNPDACFQPVAS